MVTKPINPATAKATAPTTRMWSHPRTVPSEMANTRAATDVVDRIPPATSTWIAFPRWRSWASRSGARSAAATPTGTFTRKIDRQVVYWTSTPPMTWPVTKPMAAVEP